MKSPVSTIRPSSYQLIPLTKLTLLDLGGILICDGVGVGKTISSGYIILYSNVISEKPACVVCSPTLIDKWIIELEQKFQIESLPIRSEEDWETATSETAYFTGRRPRCYIASRSLFSRGVIAEPFDLFHTIVIDEIQNFRNRHTRSYRNCHGFTGGFEWKVGLTATPINNSLEDLGSELSILFQNRSVSSWNFAVQELSSTRRMDLLSPLLTRFTKGRLGIHFAERRIHSESIRYPQEYFKKVDETLVQATGRSRKQGYPLDLVTYYRLATSSSRAFSKSLGVKFDSVPDVEKTERLKRIAEESGHDKLIVFCEFEETTKAVMETLEGAGYLTFRITGKTPMAERTALISMFKNAPEGILILTSVGTEGLDLQFCSAIVNFDLNWNPMVLEQRIGRIDRIGQEKREVDVYNFQISGSIDERVITKLMAKMETIGKVFEMSESKILEHQDSQMTTRAYSSTETEVLDSELERANQLMKSFEMTDSIVCQDYDVLGSIRMRFCAPAELTRGARNRPLSSDWLRQTPDVKDWTRGLGRDVAELETVIDQYR